MTDRTILPGCGASERTGMADAILAEVLTLLEQLAESGETGHIDLRGMPLTLADRDELEARLGHGEVSAVVECAGVSEVRETAYAGVWWVRHRGGDDSIASEEIAVTRVPEILCTHPEDARQAAGRLRETQPAGASCFAPAGAGSQREPSNV